MPFFAQNLKQPFIQNLMLLKGGSGCLTICSDVIFTGTELGSGSLIDVSLKPIANSLEIHFYLCSLQLRSWVSFVFTHGSKTC